MAIYRRGSAEVSHKADASPVTEADLAAHRVLATHLAHLLPSYQVVSEEDPMSLVYRQGAGRFWLIDPLDGIKEFIARNGEFTVNIALIEHGRAVLGVVTVPAQGLSYWGVVGQGACRRGAGEVQARPLHVAVPRGGDRPLRVMASKSHLNEATRALIARMGHHELVQAGSSLKFCRIAEGAADVYPRLGPTCEWDTAAAQAVVEAAGGHVCTLQGEPLRYGKAEVLNPDFVVSAVPLADLLVA